MNHRQFVAHISDIGYHTTARWLTLGKVLKSMKPECRDSGVLWKKGKDVPELSDGDWMADLAFAVDATALMNELNTKLQCKGLFAHEMDRLVKTFMGKWQFSFKPSGG